MTLLQTLRVSARFPFVCVHHLECEMSQTWNCLYKSENFSQELHLLPASMQAAAETNFPMLCLSSTSEDTSVVVTSSPELHAEQKLALLDGERISVTSALLTSTVTLGLITSEDFVQSLDQTVLSVDRKIVQHCVRDDSRDGTCCGKWKSGKSDHKDCA